MKVRDRAAEIKGIFYKHCKDIIYSSPEFEINESKRRTDCVTISEEIKFIDGSLLNFVDKGIRKPLNHLLVGIKKAADKKLLDILPGELLEHGGPHYMAPGMKFNDFMGMIIVNYFDNHKTRNRMMKALGL